MADFVEMEKDGVHLIVHPSTVKAHQAAGWTVVREGVSLPEKSKKPSDETKISASDEKEKEAEKK